MWHKLLTVLPPEVAHDVAIKALRFGLVCRAQLPERRREVFGLSFKSPIGLAAGFDKNAEALPGLIKLGFGFVEVGTVTPKPQPGNPKPRLFRASKHKSLINCLGFNNKGSAYVLERLQKLPKHKRHGCLVGVNLGKNKDTQDAAVDYCQGIETFAAVADYLTLNLSSPNTPGLRDLQQVEQLKPFLQQVADTLKAQKKQPPLLLKLSPDMAEEDFLAVMDLVPQYPIAGLIVSNTTLDRPAVLPEKLRTQAGGLSGALLEAKATEALNLAHSALPPAFPLIGVGGITDTSTAMRKLAAGASLVQVYTGFVYKGPALVRALTLALK